MNYTLVQLICIFVGVIGATPWEPEPRENNTYWKAKHEYFLNTTKYNSENRIEIIFLGDSLTDFWGYKGYGQAVWEATFAPRGAVNYGIGGDRTEHVLWRILNGEIENLTPKAVVLLIGANNLIKRDAVVDVAKGIQEIIKTLQEKLPKTKILLLGLLPCLNHDYAFRTIADINLRISRLENGTTVRFLDMWYKFAQSWPSIVPELYTKDLLHISTAGYQKWADTMTPILENIINSDDLGNSVISSNSNKTLTNLVKETNES